MATLVLQIGAAGERGHSLALYQRADDDDGLLTLLAADEMPALPEEGDGVGSFGTRQMRAEFAAADTPTVALDIIGSQLYAAIAQPKIAPYLEALFQPGANTALALALDASVAELPWELLQQNGRLLSVLVPLYRVRLQRDPLALPAFGSHEASSWPLRVLVVLAIVVPEPESGDDHEEPPAAQELQQLCDAMHRREAEVDLRICEQPTRKELVAEIAEFKPHVLHFIGHGGREPGAGGRPYLRLSVDDSNQEPWYSNQILNDLAYDPNPAERLRLVVLNACRSDDRSVEAQLAWTISEAFLDRGVTAVIGMSCDVAERSAAAFAAALFRHLAAASQVALGVSLEHALMAARRQVQLSESDGGRLREWAAPILISSKLPASVIQVGDRAISATLRERVGLEPSLNEVRRLVGRRDQRYSAWRGFQTASGRINVLVGPQGSGKTKFVHMLMERCALRGHTLRYINLQQGRANDKVDFFDLLIEMRREPDDRESLLFQALPTAPFAAFDQAVADWFGRRIDLENRRRIPALKATQRAPKSLNSLFAAFRASLDKVANATTRLVFVIDHLKIDAHDFSILHERLFRPYSASDTVAFLLLLEEEQAGEKQYNLAEHAAIYHQIPVGYFERRDWIPLAFEYVRRHEDLFRAKGIYSDEFLLATRQTIRKYNKPSANAGPWKPERLPKLIELITMLST
jgi:CHAT domain-containing protein